MLIWKTRDGKKLKPSEMEDGHIRNCISLMKRNINDASDNFCDYSGDADGAYWAGICNDRDTQDYIDHAEAVIEEFEKELESRKPKYMYAIPDLHMPSDVFRY